MYDTDNNTQSICTIKYKFNSQLKHFCQTHLEHIQTSTTYRTHCGKSGKGLMITNRLYYWKYLHYISLYTLYISTKHSWGTIPASYKVSFIPKRQNFQQKRIPGLCRFQQQNPQLTNKTISLQTREVLAQRKSPSLTAPENKPQDLENKQAEATL